MPTECRPEPFELARAKSCAVAALAILARDDAPDHLGPVPTPRP